MIDKLSCSTAIVLMTAVVTATPVAADPSPFSVLSCSCDGNAAFLYRGRTLQEQMDTGIQNGLIDLLDNGNGG